LLINREEENELSRQEPVPAYSRDWLAFYFITA